MTEAHRRKCEVGGFLVGLGRNIAVPLCYRREQIDGVARFSIARFRAFCGDLHDFRGVVNVAERGNNLIQAVGQVARLEASCSGDFLDNIAVFRYFRGNFVLRSREQRLHVAHLRLKVGGDLCRGPCRRQRGGAHSPGKFRYRHDAVSYCAEKRFRL